MPQISLRDGQNSPPEKASRMGMKSWWSWKLQEMKASKHSYVLLAPYMLLFVMFTVIPVVISIILSFTYFNMLEFPRFIGWQNYTRLFLEDDVFLIAIKNTLLFAIITGPISYIACFVFAWIINELTPKWRAFMTLIFYAPSISGNVYFIWLMIFSGDRYGIANGLLIKWGFLLEPIQWLKTEAYIMPILILVQLWLSLGTGFLAFIAGLQTVDRTLYEAGAVDGIKNRWQELWYITLPSMRPQLMFGAVIQLTTSFAVADVSIALAGFPSVNYAAETVVTHLIDFGTTRFEMGYASAIATVLFMIMVGTNLLVQKLLRRVGE
ncbi:carbohydrate ABC transporter membrane protein 1, CUT1 family [Paenibacillus sp. CF095]|nr:carbohydrate ABC transporter membrane protein 1, CUT1 family [Paenibacillus sp. CF095]